jgi:hypothetical protein
MPLVIGRLPLRTATGRGFAIRLACRSLLRRDLARAPLLLAGAGAFHAITSGIQIGANDFDRFPSVKVVGNETTTGYRQQIRISAGKAPSLSSQRI